MGFSYTRSPVYTAGRCFQNTAAFSSFLKEAVYIGPDSTVTQRSIKSAWAKGVESKRAWDICRIIQIMRQIGNILLVIGLFYNTLRLN